MFAVSQSAHERLLDDIGDALWHAERRRKRGRVVASISPATEQPDTAKDKPFPPEPGTRGLYEINAFEIALGMVRRLGDISPLMYSPEKCDRIVERLLGGETVFILNRDLNIVGKIKAERQQKFCVPVCRLYRIA